MVLSVNKQVTKINNKKAWGPEIKKEGVITDQELGKMLNWYNGMWSTADYKKNFLKYTDNDKLKALDEYYFRTIGALIKIQQHGAQLPEKALSYLNKQIKKLEDIVRAKKQIKIEKVKRIVNIQAATRLKAFRYINDIMDKFDDDKEFKLYNFIQKENISTKVLNYIKDNFDEAVNELQLALSGDDEQCVEAYSHFTKKQIKDEILFYQNQITTINSCISNNNRQRKSKKVKSVSNEKRVKGIKFLERYNELQLVSLSPEMILDKDEMWVYDTKKRKISIYKAQDNFKLSVKGASIVNYDESKSLMKTLRKPKDQLSLFKGTSKRKWKKAFDDINSKPQKVSLRLNKETIILKVF